MTYLILDGGECYNEGKVEEESRKYGVGEGDCCFRVTREGFKIVC